MLAGPHFADFKRSSGPFGVGWRASDIVGGFLAIFTPFILSFALLAKRKILKVLGFAAIGICLMGLFATYSRGAILAFAAASIATILASLKHFFKTSKLAVVIILMVLVGLSLSWQRWVPESIVHRAESTIKGKINAQDYWDRPSLDESSQGRIDKWKAGIAIFLTAPIFGVGFKIPEYMLSYDAHNTFILVAAEMGIFGLLVFLWLLFAVFRESLALLNTEFVPIAIGFIGCLVGFFVVNMFYANFFRDTVVGSFWIILGILAACKKNAFALKASKVKRHD